MLRRVTLLLRLMFRKWVHYKRYYSLYAEVKRVSGKLLVQHEENRRNMLSHMSDSENEGLELMTIARAAPILKIALQP